MFLRVLSLLIVSALAFANATTTLQETIDVKRLQGILQENLKSKDITSLYYAIKGLHQLKADIPNVCEDIKNSKYDEKNIEQVYYLTNAAALTNCLNSVKPDILSSITHVLDKKDATIADLYYAVYSLKALGKGSVYDKEDGLKNLIQLLKKDDSPVNYGYVFGLCEHMGCGAWTTTHAEGVLLAADESDGKALHFEGGLPATSLLLTTIIRTYKSQKKPSPLSEEQRYKFAQYLVSRSSVNSARGAALLLDAAFALADDEPTPICIAVKGKKYITAESDSIEVGVTDLVGRAVRGLEADLVVAQSATRLADDVVVLSKQPLVPKPGQPGTFLLSLAKIKAQYGVYKVALSAGSHAVSVNVAVLGEIQVTSVEIGVGDVDGVTSPKVTTVVYPNELSEKLQADHLQKVSLKFTVKDKQNKPVLVQQAFVLVTDGDEETVFIAEPDNAKNYKVELKVGSISKLVGGRSGPRVLTLLLGDSAAASPILWKLGQLHFNFPSEALAAPAPGGRPRGPLPALSHTSRVPEPRPARLLSDVFALACAGPLLLLLLLWAALGVNLRHFPFTPSAIVFHLALGASLGLYGLLWLKLNMFETMRYLLPLGILTFLSGHRLLRRLVQDKTSR